jgi:hypothetical protein
MHLHLSDLVDDDDVDGLGAHRVLDGAHPDLFQHIDVDAEHAVFRLRLELGLEVHVREETLGLGGPVHDLEAHLPAGLGIIHALRDHAADPELVRLKLLNDPNQGCCLPDAG